MRRVPRYLWPADHQRPGFPFRDGDVVRVAERVADATRHMTLGEILQMSPEEIQNIVTRPDPAVVIREPKEKP